MKLFCVGYCRFPRGRSGKESACQCRRCRRLGFPLWVGKNLWRRKWQPQLVFLPGKFHAQRNLVGYSPGNCKESDMTEHNTEDYLYAQPVVRKIHFFPLWFFIIKNFKHTEKLKISQWTSIYLSPKFYSSCFATCVFHILIQLAVHVGRHPLYSGAT